MTQPRDTLITDHLAAMSELSATITDQIAQLGARKGSPQPQPQPGHVAGVDAESTRDSRSDRQPVDDPPPAEPPQVHGPRVTVSRSSGMASGAAPQAQRHLDDLVREHSARTRTSKELAQRHRGVLADSRARVGFRQSTKEMHYPIAARRAWGPRIEDVDGNQYVDITMGFGVLLFGHEPGFVNEAVREHLAGGIRLGPRGAETGEAAELLSELTGMPRVAFANSGTEANSAAIRLARAATGRDKIVMFHGSYHGHADNVLGRSLGAGADRETVPVSTGIPRSAVADLIVLDYGAPESLRVIQEHSDQIAAVLVEPVQSRDPSLRPVEFVRSLRELTRRCGIVLLFDEMLTGFRPGLRGAQEFYGVTPDLATYGKLLGGGYPIGAVAGRADIMDGIDGGFWRYGDDSYPVSDTTFFGGTYIQHPVSMAAAGAVLRNLKARSPQLQQRLNARTERMAAALNRCFQEEEFPLRTAHFGSMFRFEHRANMELLYHHLMLKGVYVWEWRNFFLSTEHTDSDVDFIVDAVVSSLRELRRAGFFPGGRGGPTGVDPKATVPSASPAPLTSGPAQPTAEGSPRRSPPDLSVYFFGDYPRGTAPDDSYELISQVARFADERGFHAVWLPERHFHSFGGSFPNPSVLAAALARETSRIRLNAGSVVLPLHDSIRVAEEWAMVDNLSGGRVGIGCASGWNSRDFVFFPERFAARKEVTLQQIEQVRTLWRGDAVRRSAVGGEVEIRLFPRPVQSAPPMFTAIVGNPDSYLQAARHDLGVVTNLMSQSVEQLAENIARYRQVRADHGLDPEAGRVAVLLHTYLGEDHADARRAAYQPLSQYMRSSLSLFGQVTSSLGQGAGTVDLTSLTEDDLDVVFSRAYDRYCDQRALIGSPESCLPVIDALAQIGVDEVAALVDFGVTAEQLRAGLPHLDQLRRRLHERPALATPDHLKAPLSPAQQRIWTVERLQSGGAAFHETTAIRLEGPLDVQALRAALVALTERHEALRAVFPDIDGSPRQVVKDTLAPTFTLLHRVGVSEEDAVREMLATENARCFDLAEGPLFVATVAQLSEQRHVMVLSFHHIVIDAVSAGIFVRDLAVCYRAAQRGVADSASSAGRQAPPYREVVRRHVAALQSDPKVAADLAYWKQVLGPDLPVLELPADHPRSAQMSSRGRSLFRELPADLTTELRQLSRRSHSTLFMTLLAGVAAMLRRFSGQDDIVIGTPVVDRPEGAEEVIGCFLNTVALRLDLTGDPTFAQLLARVRGSALDAYDHADAPFDSVVQAVEPPRDTSRTPIFQAIVEYESGDPFALDLPGVQATPLAAAADRSVADLTIYFTARSDSVGCRVEYCADLFTQATAESFFDCFTHILHAAARDPAAPVSTVGVAPDLADVVAPDAVETVAPHARGSVTPHAESPRLTGPPEAFCQGPPCAVADTTVHALVTRQAELAPGRPAVICGDVRLSYGELNRRADRLAARLRAAVASSPSGGADQIIGVWLPRSVDLIVAMLAVLKSGAAYLPLDPALGSQRVSAVLADQARVVITSHAAAALPPLPTGVAVVDMDDEAAAGAGAEAASEAGVGATAGTEAESLCYVIYTSGTTGGPKGVAVSHRSVVNLCQWHRRRFAFTPADRSALVCSQSFDASVLEVWPALTAGASIAIAGEETRLDPPALARWYTDSRVTFSILPTTLGESVLALPPEQQPSLHHLLLGGDVLRRRPHPGAPYEVVNVYGPTETTVLVTTETVAPAAVDPRPVSIGRPIDNTVLHVLDAARRPVALGDPGELHVSGPGVARGYLSRPEETAERFISDPCDGGPDQCGGSGHGGGSDLRSGTDLGGSGRVLYRTGDLVRWLPDGGLEFCGRTDDQVKIRGFRVEPGEVTQALLTLPEVAQAVVAARRDEHDEAYLAGYVVPATATATEDFLRRTAAALAEQLPAYLTPRAWAVLDALPLSANGKVDREALPEPAVLAGFVEPAAPLSDLEDQLRSVWCAVLQLDPGQVAPDTEFFELGGDSIRAIRLLNRVRDDFGVEYPVAGFFRRPTVRAMAAALADGSDLALPETAAGVADRVGAGDRAPDSAVDRALDGSAEQSSRVRGEV